MKAVFSTRGAACLLWLFAVGAGTAVLLNPDAVRGSMGKPPQKWPERAQVPLDSKKATLVMFCHPHCPYTRASLAELRRLLNRYPERIAANVYFLRPGEFSETWTYTSLWRTAAGIPGVEIFPDANGNQARQFGARASGHVLFYAPTGQLLFKGGITPGRGHTGDNAGSSAIIALLSGRNPLINETPVYGCSLGEPSETAPIVTATFTR